MPDRVPHPSAVRFRRITRLLLVPLLALMVLRMSGCMERLFFHPERGEVVPPANLRGVEDVFFTSADGTRLHGWFIAAKREPGDVARPATILHAHGNAGNIEGHIVFSEDLARAGFNLFIFDYRGYGQSEGTARSRRNLIADTHAALDVLLKRDDVDPNRIGLFGHSLGGAIGIVVMNQRPEIRCAVFEAAFSSWRKIAQDVVGFGPVGWFIGWSLIDDSHKPIDAVRTIDRPLLFLHGTADSIIPVAHSRALNAAAGPKSMLIEYEGGDHNDMHWSHPQCVRDMIEFFERELAAEGQRSSAVASQSSRP